MQVPHLFVNVSVFKGGTIHTLIDHPPTSAVKTITFDGPLKGSVAIEHVLMFLNHFPALTMLDCWKDIADHHLLVLKALPRLQGLNLSNCNRVQPGTIATVACALGDNLRTFSAPGMDEASITVITASCHSLEDLNISCANSSAAAGLARLCAGNASTLKKLSLNDSAASVVELIISSCPHLTHFTFHAWSMDTPSIALRVLTHCSEILLIALPTLMMNLCKDPSSRTRIALKAYQGFTQDQSSFLSVLPYPIYSYRSVFFSCAAAVAALKCLEERSGEALEVLGLDLMACRVPDYGEFSLGALVGRCPHLITFECQMSFEISFESWCALPRCCPRLRTLVLRILSDFSLFYLFEAFKRFPNTVETLELLQSAIIADCTLVLLAEAFPHLRTFTASSITATNKDLWLELILSRKLNAKRIKLGIADVPRWIADELKKRGIHHRVDRNWLYLPL